MLRRLLSMFGLQPPPQDLPKETYNGLPLVAIMWDGRRVYSQAKVLRRTPTYLLLSNGSKISLPKEGGVTISLCGSVIITDAQGNATVSSGSGPVFM